MFTLRKITGAIMIALLSTTYAVAQQPAPAQQQQAQTNFSDAELKNFANAYQKIQMLSQNMQQKMVQVVQDEGMDVQRFNEIHQAKMTPGQEANATAEEEKVHGQIVAKIEGMQKEFDGSIQELLKNENISMEKYEQIAMALQQDPNLQARVQKLMQG